MEDLKQIQEFFGPPAGVNTAYRVDFTKIENKEVTKDFELFKDLEKAKSKFEQLKKDPFMGSIKIEKIYGGETGKGDRYLGGSEEIGSYSNPVNNTKSSELTDEEIDIKIYMTTPSFISAKRGYKEKEDLMAYLGRRKKATSDFVNGALEENMSKSAIMRQIKDAEEILDSGEADGMPLDNETEMLVQQELARLKKLAAVEFYRKKGMKEDINEMDINDPVLIALRAKKMANDKKREKISSLPKPKKMKISQKAADLVDGYELEDLEMNLKQIYRDMEQEAEPEGGPIADQYADEIEAHEQAIRFIKNKGKERAQMTYDQAIAEVAVPSSLITKFAAEVKDVSSFSKLLLNLYDAIQDKEQKDFTKNQKFGRAIAFLKDLADDKPEVNEQEDKDDNRVPGAALILPRGKEVILQAEEKDYKRGLLVELTNKGGYKIKYWYGDDVKVYPAEVVVDGESIKKDAEVVDILFHPELKEELKTTTNVNEMKANEFVKTVNDEFDLETLELMKKVIESRVELLNKMQDVANPRTVVKGFRRYDEVAETIKFIKGNNPSATVEEVIKELKEIKELGQTLNEELCAAGKAYRKRRMAAGEKSSAYLSGRAVKVCKGQMSGKKKKKK